MKYSIPLVLLLMASDVYCQVSLTKGPKVNGLALGATRNEVIKKLGKPSSESKRKADECVGGTEMTLHYPGLKLLLWDDPDDPRRFAVGKFEISSARWDVSGIRIGQPNSAVRKQFGARSTEEKQSGQLVWFYFMDENISPGSTNFHFRNGKLIKIISLWQMC